MRTRWAGLALVVAVAGCGGGSGGAAATPTPTLTTPAPSPTPTGPDAFVADVRRAGLAGRDLPATTDQQILTIGRQTCRVFDTQQPPTPADRQRAYGIAVQVVQLGSGATASQSSTLVSSAIRNLCPVNSDVLPEGTTG